MCDDKMKKAKGGKKGVNPFAEKMAEKKASKKATAQKKGKAAKT